MSVDLANRDGRTVLTVTSGERLQAGEVVKAVRESPQGMKFGGTAQAGEIPAELRELLIKVLAIVARGDTVTIGSLPDELTTTVAAAQLGVSRPTLMRMIREGQIPAHKVGSHHRLRTSDVLDARRKRLDAQRRAFNDLRDLEDSLKRG